MTARLSGGIGRGGGLMNVCVLSSLHEAATAAEAARYAANLANHAVYGRLCLMQLAGGKWAVCLYRGG